MDSRTRRDGRPLEARPLPAPRAVSRGPRVVPQSPPALTLPASQYLGWYNPLKHETQLDAPAIKKWLDVGAQPTVSVENLLKKALIVPAGEKKVYSQMSTKDATAAKNARAAAVKKARPRALAFSAPHR